MKRVTKITDIKVGDLIRITDNSKEYVDIVLEISENKKVLKTCQLSPNLLFDMYINQFHLNSTVEKYYKIND